MPARRLQTRRLLLTLAAGLVALLLWVLAGCDGWAKSPMAPTAGAPALPAETAKPIDLPQNLTPEQTRDLLSRLSDEQVRALLLSQLDKAAAAITPAPRSSDMVFNLMQSMHELRGRLDAMLSALPTLPSIGSFVLKRVTTGYEPDYIWRLAAATIAVFAVALLGEALFRKLLRPVISRLPVLEVHSDFGKLGVLLLRAAIQLIELAVFGVVAVVAFFCLYDGHEAAHLAFWTVFLFIVLFRASSIVLRLLLAPHAPALRLPPVDDAAARRLYRDFLFLVALSLFCGLAGHFLVQIEVALGLMLAVGQLLFLVNLTAIIAVIWRRRFGIAHLVGVRTAASGEKPMGLGGLFVAYWHIFAICYVLAIGVLGTADRLLTGEIQAAHALPTLGLLCAIPLIDGLLRMVIRSFFGGRGDAAFTQMESAVATAATPAVGTQPGAAAEPARASRTVETGYGEVVLHNGRILLGVAAVLVFADIWDINVETLAAHGLGTRIAASLFDIILTLVLAFATWGIIRTTINRQLSHESLDPLALAHDEKFSLGLSRLETLLPLLRKFILVTLVMIVTMIIISSMGINIGPLLAGAGIVGIAIGFGAQTLVRDILSGIFFLVDDAFRIGEYIDVGEGKGTVERMSIRALMLRHHLGQIHTIPFGVIRRVTNYSRDWVIMKLEIRVPYETDLELVRKIVKRIGQEMLAHPDYGENFIQPLKSQGVHRMDDSSFIVRVKFMAKPGEQFILRREVFRLIQEAFHKQGVGFAPRRVVVEAVDRLAVVPAGAAAVADGTDAAKPGG